MSLVLYFEFDKKLVIKLYILFISSIEFNKIAISKSSS